MCGCEKCVKEGLKDGKVREKVMVCNVRLQ